MIWLAACCASTQDGLVTLLRLTPYASRLFTAANTSDSPLFSEARLRGAAELFKEQHVEVDQTEPGRIDKDVMT